MATIKYSVIQKGYVFDSYGNEEWQERIREREAEVIYRYDEAYRSKETVYWAPECGTEEAESVCKKYNEEVRRRNPQNPYAPSLRFETVPYGKFFIEHFPYND